MSTATLEPIQSMPTTTPTRTAPAHLDRIVLTGFMGSGKTTTGRLLADHLGWTFLDLDLEIEARQQLSGDQARSVPQIFAKYGEAHFRHLESAALATLLGRRSIVLALGGGAPEALGNRLLLEQTPRTAVVHLAAPLPVLLDRCRQQAADPTATARPVLADPDAAALRFHHRRPLYERLATHHIDTSTLTPTEAVTAILKTLNHTQRID